MTEFWNERYGQAQFAYGKEPNAFLAAVLPKYPVNGKILFPADGEGRNGVFAATLGWDVHSFDQSTSGRDKALDLARERGVTIQYDIADYTSIQLTRESYSAIGLFYVHSTPEVKERLHAKLISSLKPGGIVILEAFSKGHELLQKINPAVGGPPIPDRFYSREEIERDFAKFDIVQLEELKTELSEGLYHRGMSSVIRFVGVKQM